MIREVFDAWAENWDVLCHHNDKVIRTLLKHADINCGTTVLDVGCGTGILEKYLLEIPAARITAVDFAPGMIKKAIVKYKGYDIDFRCVDIMEIDSKETFDRIVIYNVFTHFPDSEAIINKCSELLNPYGRLLICHGSSRDDINRHHNMLNYDISGELPPAIELKEIMRPYFDIDNVIDSEDMYAVSGIVRDKVF